jgi:2-amino-4-hydroxy-6-hydroxymethyldihydropteridine diphosphokinase
VPSRIGLLGLGSNLGERRVNMQRAADALPPAGVKLLASSSTYDTDPVGELPDQPSFLNACLLVETELEPLKLLEEVKGLERALGRRDGEGRQRPRLIDIDILLLGDLELANERIAVPHGQLLQRRFVLIPALELDFDLSTPAGASLADALLALPLSEGVRWAGPPLSLADPGAPDQ